MMILPRFLYLVLLHQFLLVSSLNNNNNNTRLRNDQRHSDETWRNAEKIVRQMMDMIIKNALPVFMKIHSEITLSRECMGSLMKLFFDLRQFKGWAVKMIDAMGKPPAGIMEGVLSSLGSYDECLNIEVQETRRKSFLGQYCLIQLWPPLPPKPNPSNMRKFLIHINWDILPTDKLFDMAKNYSVLFHLAKFQYGICLPSTCSEKDVKNLITAVAHQMKFNASLHRCETKVELEFSAEQIVISVFLVFILLLVTIGTLLDTYASYFKKHQQYCLKHIDTIGKGVEILLAFSIVRSTNRLLKPEATYQELSALHGFRFLTVTGIIMAATYGYFDPMFYRKLGYLYDITRTVTFQILLGGQVAVNSLFFLSGLLTMYFTVKSLKGTNRTISFHIFFIHRLCRLIPSILLVLGLMMMIPLISSGPVWHEMVGHYIGECRSTWWANILFISNWWPFSQMCLLSMWFLSTDMQLHVLATLVLFPFFRNRKLALFIGILLELCRAITVAVVTLVYNIEAPMMSPDKEIWIKMIDKIYLKPHSLYGAFSVGLLAGYLIVEYPNTVLELKYRILGWCFTIACSLAMLCLPHHLGKTEEQDVVGTVLYMTFHQTAWAISMAWIAVICALGYGGIIQKVLSFKLIIPLSRLSFAAFLIHEVVIRTRYGTIRQTIVFSHYNMFYEFCTHFITSFALAYACYVTVEAPFAKLEKILFPNWNYATKRPSKENCLCTSKEIDTISKASRHK